MPFDLLIHNGSILTVNKDFEIIARGMLGISDGRIVHLAPQTKADALPEASHVIDASGGIIMPGLINAHTHLPMTLFRGLADDLPLEVWLNQIIFPAESRFINADSVHWGTMLAAAEMILSGITTCCDGYFMEASVAAAINRCGLRGVLGQGVIDFPAPGIPDPAENIQSARAYLEQCRHISDLINPSIFCHSPYTCSRRTLQQAKRIAAESGLLFQIHVAETQSEVDRFRVEKNQTAVQYLDELGLLDEDTLLVHCVWINQRDIETIAARKCTVVHCPESNMKLASGVAPIPDLLKAGVPVALGSDGCASNNNADLFHEMDVAAKTHKVWQGDPTVMDARTMVKMVTIEGAKAIGRDSQVGSLELGKAADVIIIDCHQPHLVPMYHPESHVVYCVRAGDVNDLMVAGKVLMRNRRLLTIDVTESMHRVNSLAADIRNQLSG